jgi:two-component system CheB/CheR fusion protein
MLIEANQVYTIPSNTSMVVKDHHVGLRPRAGKAGHVMPIDDLFRSLADTEKDRAVGVVLSGTASDGAEGMKALKAAGGTTLAQDAGSARYFEMPRASIASGAVDFVLPPEEIAHYLARLARDPAVQPAPPDEVQPSLLEDQGRSLSALFRELHRAFGVDFSAYKQSTVGRRIRRRMVQRDIDRLEDYLRLARDSPEELRRLYQEMFVGVTGFFREPHTFKALQKTVFPRVLENREADDPVRIWVPGCSTGEEVYSIAVSLLEHLDDRSGSVAIQIFGTDINEEAISRARVGRYPASVAVDIGKARLGRFFLKKDDGYQVNSALRDLCVFARHDLLRDPPFSRLDLLSCRNLLIYLGPGLQQRLVPLFHYALRPDRFLLLGSAETIGGHSNLFDLVEHKSKIYAKKPGVVIPHLESPADGAAARGEGKAAAGKAERARSDVDRHRDAADLILLNQYAPSSVLVNADMEILHFRGRTGPYLEPSPGVASLNLLKMAREGLLVGLQSAVETARTTDAPAHAAGLHVESEGRERIVDLRVVPVRTPASEQRTYLVLFEQTSEEKDAPPPGRPGGEATRAARRKEDARVAQLRQELAAAKAYLQSLVEGQEAGNEELRSTNEELLSTNEELQSTAEELETSNEELQSANEELITLNEELQRRHAEVREAHGDILNLLAAIRTSLVVVDKGLVIRRFTPFAEEVLGLHSSHVGRPLGELRLKVDIPEIEPLLREVAGGGPQVDREVQCQEGRWYALHVRPFLTVDDKLSGAVLALSDVHRQKQMEERFRVALLPAPITVFSQDRDLRYTWIYKPVPPLTGDVVLGRTDRDLFDAEDADRLTELKQRVLKTGHGGRDSLTISVGGERRTFDVFVQPITDRYGRVSGIVCASWDATEQEQAKAQARQLAVLEERNRLAREMHDGLAQDLVGVLLQLEAEEEAVNDDLGRGPEVVRRAREQIRQVLEGARRALLALRPRMLEAGDLTGALDRMAAEISEQTPASVRVDVRGVPRPLGPEVEENVFRVAQEALLNAARHAEARQIVVELGFLKDAVRLQVRDDGRGFERTAVRADGFGFTTMRERTERLGGEIAIESRPGRGTRVKARVPTRRRREKKKA